MLRHKRTKTIYVYVDRRSDNREPFYVGKGLLNRTRDFKRRNRFWLQIAAKHGVNREIVFQTENEQEAIDQEARLIFELKTRNLFGGANTSDGGQGPSGYCHSKTRREIISAYAKNRWRTPDGRREASKKFAKMWDERRDEIMKSHIKGSSHHRAKLKESDVIEIRRLYAELDRVAVGNVSRFVDNLAQRFGVTGQNIFRIIHRRTWTHLV